MSYQEIITALAQSSPSDRRRVQAYLNDAFPEDETLDAAELDRRMVLMDSGKAFTWDEIKRRKHQTP